MPLLPAASIKATAMQSDNKRLTTRGSSTNDESPPERIRPKYPSAQKRKAALALFEAGTGYKSAAALLGLSVYTVRDWHRKFKKGTFHVELNPKQYRHVGNEGARHCASRERLLLARSEHDHGRQYLHLPQLAGRKLKTQKQIWLGARMRLKLQTQQRHFSENAGIYPKKACI